MNSWDIRTLKLRPHAPAILATAEDSRAVALEIPAGEELQDHQVHERAWVIVIDGEVEFTTAGGERLTGGPGLTVEFAPGERHAVLARTTARLLLLLTPWPGEGHPGAMTLEEKATVTQRAREKAGQP
ncbi:MAG TPA: cupin domain-containing protein [Solirubrobacteraceae bacterium]|nr:cupin domain-containing protein [Solirubrobacteraceae bacterium]